MISIVTPNRHNHKLVSVEFFNIPSSVLLTSITVAKDFDNIQRWSSQVDDVGQRFTAPGTSATMTVKPLFQTRCAASDLTTLWTQGRITSWLQTNATFEKVGDLTTQVIFDGLHGWLHAIRLASLSFCLHCVKHSVNIIEFVYQKLCHQCNRNNVLTAHLKPHKCFEFHLLSWWLLG